MKAYRNTFLLIAILFVILFILIGPGKKNGPGLKGVIDSVGKGPTWVAVGNDRIYVSNFKTSTIDCFYLDSGKYAGRIENVHFVGRILYSPETEKIYAAAGEIGAGMLLQIDPKTYNIDQQLNVELECRSMVVSPDGKFIYTVWGGWREGPGWFTKHSTGDFEYMAAVGSTRESPTDILLSPDGKKAYVSSHYGQRSMAEFLGGEDVPGLYSVVEVFDAGSLELLDEINVGLKPQSMAAFGNGRYIIVASTALENEKLGLPGFSIIDTQTDEVIKEIFTPGYFPFMVVASDELGKAFATYMYKTPKWKEPPAASEEDETDESGIIDIRISGGNAKSEAASDEKEEILLGSEVSPAVDENIEYVGMAGWGFLSVDLNDYSVDVYDDERGWPFYSLCILDEKKIIAVSSLADKLVVLEATEPGER